MRRESFLHMHEQTKGNTPSDIVPLSRVPDSARVGVEHGRSIDVALLGGRERGGAGKRGEGEHGGSKGLREHHRGRQERYAERKGGVYVWGADGWVERHE